MKNRSRTEYSMLNILTGVGGYFLNTVLGFVCRMVFVRCLSAEYLGVNGLFTNIITMLSLAELGVGSAIGYALYKPLARDDRDTVAALIRLYGRAYRVIGLAVGIIGLALMPFLKVIIPQQPDIAESLYLLYGINLFNTVLTYFFSYRTSLLIAAQRNYVVAGINYAVSVVQSLLQMGFLLLWRNYLGYLLIQTAGTFAFNFIASQVALKQFPYIRGKQGPELSDREKRDVFRNVRDLMIYKVSGLLVNSTDNILITFFNGLATTGVASNYTLLVNTLNSLLGQVFNGLTASIGNHNASETQEKKYEMFRFLNLMNFWIFGWAALGICFCASDLVALCFGQEYVLPAEIPLIMAANFFTVGMSNAVWTYKHTMGLFRYGRSVQLFTGVLNIVFSVVLGEKFGLAGILGATLLARGCTNLWYDPYAVYTHGFHRRPVEYLIKYLGYLAVLLAAGLACRAAFLPVSGPLYLRVLLKILLCSLVTNGVFLLVFGRTREFKQLLGYGRRLLRR